MGFVEIGPERDGFPLDKIRPCGFDKNGIVFHIALNKSMITKVFHHRDCAMKTGHMLFAHLPVFRSYA